MERRAKKHKLPTTKPLYQETMVMRHFRMTPKEWGSISRMDRTILSYSRLMENHYEALQIEKQQKEAKREQARQKAMSKMPRLRGR